MRLELLSRHAVLEALARDARPSTLRQRELLVVILELRLRLGRMPTLREIACCAGVCLSCVHGHLSKLRRSGWVIWEYNREGTLRVLGFVPIGGH